MFRCCDNEIVEHCVWCSMGICKNHIGIVEIEGESYHACPDCEYLAFDRRPSKKECNLFD